MVALVAQLFFRYGAMNSGKTIEILKVAHNYEEQDKSVIIMTSGLDDRDEVGYVSSRIGLKRKAYPIFEEDDLLAKVKELDPNAACVLVDEAQFLSKHHVLELTRVVDELNIPVMTFGLKNDFRNELFEGSKYLLLYASNNLSIKISLLNNIVRISWWRNIMFATHWIIGFVATDLDLFAIINWLAIIYSQVHDRFFIAKPADRFHLFDLIGIE